jgi:fructose-1,6-bisphosphatase/inositol monophosphatase family enzyme
LRLHKRSTRFATTRTDALFPARFSRLALGFVGALPPATGVKMDLASVLDPADLQALLLLLQKTQQAIRDRVVAACEAQTTDELSAVAEDAEGDTLFAIDKVSEAELLRQLEPAAERFGGFVLIAEGVAGGELCLPRGLRPEQARFRIIVDPIDGTRGIMYQKRSAWVLAALAPNLGAATSLRDVVLCVQTEIPTVKQHLCDELWAVRGQGAFAERFDRVTKRRWPLQLRPSAAPSIAQGYAMITRFFPGARDELAAIDEALMRQILGVAPPGKALCFEDQYASSGGQFYELLAGHDRFNADLRPLMRGLLQQRGAPAGLCCHPYDVCTALIAEELGVILTDPEGKPFDVPLNVEADVAWVGYANAAIRQQVEPVLQAVLKQRGWLPALVQP